MKSIFKTSIVLLLTALFITGCSNDPVVVEKDPFGDADSQRSRAKQTQDELSSETNRQ